MDHCWDGNGNPCIHLPSPTAMVIFKIENQRPRKTFRGTPSLCVHPALEKLIPCTHPNVYTQFHVHIHIAKWSKEKSGRHVSSPTMAPYQINLQRPVIMFSAGDFKPPHE